MKFIPSTEEACTMLVKAYVDATWLVYCDRCSLLATQKDHGLALGRIREHRPCTCDVCGLRFTADPS